MTRPEAMQRARQMYGDGRNGWTVPDLQRYLKRNGVDVAQSTVRRWVVAKYAAAEGERHRRYRLRTRGTSVHRLRILDERALLSRLTELRGATLSFNAAAKVVNLDHGLDLTENEAREAVLSGRVPFRFRGIEVNLKGAGRA